MVTYDEYLRGILEKITESYGVLEGMRDKPGDLDAIKLELLKIKGFFQVVAHKIDPERYPSLDIKRLQSKAEHYLNAYYFEKEIETASALYAEDPGRIRNLRLAILESLNDRRLMEHIAETIEKM